MKHKLLKVGLLGLMISTTTWGQFGPAMVKVVPAEVRSMAPVRVVPAFSKAKYITTIKAESSGRVVDIRAIGEVVNAGDALGTIADEKYAHRLAEYKNAIASEQANMDFLQSESERLNSMKAQNLTSQSALDKNKSDLKASKANLAQAKARLAQLNDEINKLRITTPYDAFVTEQFAQPGQYINEGNDFMKIMSKTDTEIVTHLPIRFKHMIKQDAVWSYEGNDGRMHQAQVVGFVPAATNSSRQIEVRLTDLSGLLIPGEPIKLWVPTTEKQDVLSVPRDALVLRKDQIFIYAVVENKSKKIPVTTGIAEGDYIEIKGNVKSGDQIVIRGNERMMDGQDVQILPSE